MITTINEHQGTLEHSQVGLVHVPLSSSRMIEGDGRKERAKAELRIYT